MGKSVFWETTLHQQLKQAYPNAYIQRIGYEEIHESHCEKLKTKQRGLGDEQKIHLQAFGPATEEFNTTIRHNVESAHNNASVALLYLDKSFSEKELQQLQNEYAKDQDTRIVTVLPQSSGFSEYPLSLSFLLQCYCRCLSRRGHSTTPTKNPNQLF